MDDAAQPGGNEHGVRMQQRGGIKQQTAQPDACSGGRSQGLLNCSCAMQQAIQHDDCLQGASTGEEGCSFAFIPCSRWHSQCAHKETG